jgi:hypothetical protein
MLAGILIQDGSPAFLAQQSRCELSAKSEGLQSTWIIHMPQTIFCIHVLKPPIDIPAEALLKLPLSGRQPAQGVAALGK